ncbi:RelA/SpoT domain protein [Moritella viscosa]|nr:RelA/SpoT domain protein [Moritella viscosa]
MSSAYLYLLGFAVPDGASWDGYFLFIVLLAGGGLSYDIASKMFGIPSYRDYWGELLKRMGLILLGHILVLSGIFLAGYFKNLIDITYALSFGMVISVGGIILAGYHSYQAESTFKKLRSMFS